MLAGTTTALSRSGDLRRRYGRTGGRGFDAVRGVTFSVRRGELFALLGTNGAGKTSTMELLEGLAPPARGAVRVLGCDPWRERALVRRRIGIMLQEGGFPPDLTVAETGRMWAGTLSAPRPVAEALGLVSRGHRAGVAVRSLSGGERRLICSTGVSWPGCGVPSHPLPPYGSTPHPDSSSNPGDPIHYEFNLVSDPLAVVKHQVRLGRHWCSWGLVPSDRNMTSLRSIVVVASAANASLRRSAALRASVRSPRAREGQGHSSRRLLRSQVKSGTLSDFTCLNRT